MTEQEKIRKMAYDYWNEDIIPPEGYCVPVMLYIRDHPEEFKGVVPM